MATMQDGPRSSKFTPLAFKGNISLSTPPGDSAFALSKEILSDWVFAPTGSCVAWGIPFEIGEGALVMDQAVSIEFSPTRARWLVFLHASDLRPLEPGRGGIISPTRGHGQLGEHAADYVIRYSDGSEVREAIRRRHQVGLYGRRPWGENCFQAVAQHKPYPIRAGDDQMQPFWGWSQTRGTSGDEGEWVNWLWAWENPHPEKEITGLRFEPVCGAVIISGISAGDVTSFPLRWRTRRKACLALPEGETFHPEVDNHGLLKQIQLDLGQVISATPRLIYPNEKWAGTYNNQLPELSTKEVIIEYTAHPEACFHLFSSTGERVIPASEVEEPGYGATFLPVRNATQRVRLRVVEQGGGRPVPVRLHIHGEWGEYLAPEDRHRILNPYWFEDYSADNIHIEDWQGRERSHSSSYINGETVVKLPPGKVYIEVSKGFEIQPVRKVFEVMEETTEIVIELERVLHWRQKGWVTADTHVHFLSSVTAMLEGSAEGVNIINLLASQWGELMTNVGDFDGKNTWGSKEAGGEGEYLVRVGTENRQHILGHISLLGYQGSIIAPMTTGGPDEAALGDPIEILLTEWARQCRQQGGLVVLPHFPNPRAEHAASIVSGDIDAIEMTSWENHYFGINPYSLSDWYRYLNCGYLVPAVGGTDKMAAVTAVGTVRTYAHIDPAKEFTYETWKEAVRRAETFVTYGPLLDFMVDGRSMGSRIEMPAAGGTVDVTWEVASTTIPISHVELVVNGEIRESVTTDPRQASGSWSFHVEKSCWLALLVRGHYADKPEMIAAHSTPVMITVGGSALLSEVDAVTILDQIEGAMAYLDTVGTRADDQVYKRMRLVLESAHRSLHNRMHQQGHYHEPISRNAA